MHDHSPARQPLPEPVVGVPLERHGDAVRHKRPETLAARPREGDSNRILRQTSPAISLGDLVAKHRADRAIAVAHKGAELYRCGAVQRRLTACNEVPIEHVVQAVILFAHTPTRDAGRQLRHLQQRREVEATRLPLIHRCVDIETVGATDHLVHRPETEFSHQLTHLLRDEREEILDELGLAGKVLPQPRVLRRNTDRTGGTHAS